jgi:predicted CoA-binding protein
MNSQTVIPEGVIALLKNAEKCRIAVVGASNNREKYGNIILRNLAAKGYTVVPVHPTEKQVEGLTCYASVNEIPGGVDLVDFVIPPGATLKALDSLQGRVSAVWFQDGSFDDAVLEHARPLFPLVVSHACIMVVTNFL